MCMCAGSLLQGAAASMKGEEYCTIEPLVGPSVGPLIGPVVGPVWSVGWSTGVCVVY